MCGPNLVEIAIVFKLYEVDSLDSLGVLTAVSLSVILDGVRGRALRVFANELFLR